MYTGYIYKITNKITNLSYIGCTTRTIKWRFNKHAESYGENCSYLLKKDMRTLGRDSFFVDELEKINAENKDQLLNKLYERERYFIKKFDTYNNGYNQSIGGLGLKGYKQSQEQKEKLRIANTGKRRTDDVKKKLSESHKGKYSPLTIEKARIHNSKKVNCYSLDGVFIKSYFNQVEAGKEVNVSPSCIGQCCLGKLKTCKNLLWRYDDNDS